MYDVFFRKVNLWTQAHVKEYKMWCFIKESFLKKGWERHFSMGNLYRSHENITR